MVELCCCAGEQVADHDCSEAGPGFTAGLYLDIMPKGKLRTTAFGWVLENSELITKTMQFLVKQGRLDIHRRPVVYILLNFCQCSHVVMYAALRARVSERKINKACEIKIKRWQWYYPVHPQCDCISETKEGESKLQIPKPASSLQCANWRGGELQIAFPRKLLSIFQEYISTHVPNSCN